MKKSTFTKVLCIVLMSIMVLSLVACGGGGRNTDTEPEEPTTATVVYDTQGGTMPAGKEDTVEYDIGKKILLLPTPTKEGYEFAGWTINGEAVATPFVVEEDVVFTATWTKIGDDSSNSGSSDSSSDTETDTETETEDNRERVTITLVLNGGKLADDEVDEFEGIVGEPIGKLPTPTRAGYTFDGWFEDGNEKWEIDRKTEVEDYDMEIHALWTANGEMVTVEFFLNADETLQEGVTPYFEMVAGEMVGSFVDALPTATKASHKFVGWQDENGVRVSLTTRINSDIRLSPVWQRVVLCHDGTENHQWNAWQEYSEATCTTPAQEQRTCNLCGGTDYNITKEATGHKFGEWQTVAQTEPGKTEKGQEADIPKGFVRSRECVQCGEKEANPLTNIAYEAFNVPEVEGTGWGMDKGGNLINGDYSDCPLCGDSKSAVIVTLTAKDAVYVDVLAVTGWGSGAYEVTAYYKDGTSKGIGMGSFGSTKSFNVGAEVVKFEINMANPAYGTDFWSEITILVIPTDNE